MYRRSDPILCSLVLVAGLHSSGAAAATRTVCWQMRFVDERIGCPTSSMAGAQRACRHDAGYSRPVGHYVELWDYDSDDTDEYIGTWVLSDDSETCATFEWEGESYSTTEADPDVYVKYINRVRKIGCSECLHVDGVDGDGDDVADISWRANRVTDCENGSSCRILPGGYLVPNLDETSTTARRVMALDSVQHSLDVYDDVMTDHVEMRFPCDGCTISSAPSKTRFDLDDDDSPASKAPNHEFGHVLAQQLLNRDSLRCDYLGADHTYTSHEYESGAVCEGWADYVSAVSWWDPQNTSSEPYLGDFLRALEEPDPYHDTCSDNADTELAVAKAFWDIDDIDNESSVSPGTYDDDNAYSTTGIATGWTYFPNGTGNHDDLESDENGVNLRDYYYNTIGYFTSSIYYTLIYHNCLQAQDSG